MTDLHAWTVPVVGAIEVAGVAVILAGFIAATLRLLLSGKSAGFEDAYQHYRRNLGRAILLGLEFLVAADIINTVAVDPTLRSVAVLGAIVVIRTFLSMSLEVEITGRWPWKRAMSAGGNE